MLVLTYIGVYECVESLNVSPLFQIYILENIRAKKLPVKPRVVEFQLHFCTASMPLRPVCTASVIHLSRFSCTCAVVYLSKSKYYK